MAAKIGIVGGVGWPGTIAYYESLCRQARPLGSLGSPHISIESLDMACTIAARGHPGDERSWRTFDRIFVDALNRLAQAGCDLAAIASVTPHSRIASIAAESPIPLVNIVDAVARQLAIEMPETVLVLGTGVTMRSTIFDTVIQATGCTRIATTEQQLTEFSNLLEKYFYQNRGAEGRTELLRFVRSLTSECGPTLTILACTDLTPAFPEIGETALFAAGGIRFLDATHAHVGAILDAANA
ncbi:aspartate/glutamate racemase family protein [Aliiruegeria haliotis]|nr:aspartate/glutamate racemase family protein [Aliiruegeria haliotis]